MYDLDVFSADNSNRDFGKNQEYIKNPFIFHKYVVLLYKYFS